MLNGMTDKGAAALIPLAASWGAAPPLKLVKRPGESFGYDPAQRAYVLSCDNAAAGCALDLELLASPASPGVNPAFVVKGWRNAGAALRINGKSVPRGRDFRLRV